MSGIPFDVWGEVSVASSSVEKVKVARARGGFLLITVESGREFDVWLESLEEVEAELARLGVIWPP